MGRRHRRNTAVIEDTAISKHSSRMRTIKGQASASAVRRANCARKRGTAKATKGRTFGTESRPRRDDMDRQRGVLVRPQYDLQPAISYMLGDLIGERPRHATPFDSRGDRRAYAVDEQARCELHSARDRRAIGGWKAPCAHARIVHGDDLSLCEIARLVGG